MDSESYRSSTNCVALVNFSLDGQGRFGVRCMMDSASAANHADATKLEKQERAHHDSSDFRQNAIKGGEMSDIGQPRLLHPPYPEPRLDQRLHFKSNEFK